MATAGQVSPLQVNCLFVKMKQIKILIKNKLLGIQWPKPQHPWFESDWGLLLHVIPLSLSLLTFPVCLSDNTDY